MVYELSSVCYIYVSGVAGTIGREGITLPFTSSGLPNYNGIYNPYDLSSLSYQTPTSTPYTVNSGNSHAIKKKEVSA